MIDREKVLAVLRKRFPQSSSHNLAAAANAIVGLEDEWEEVAHPIEYLERHAPVAFAGICRLAEGETGVELRVFQRPLAPIGLLKPPGPHTGGLGGGR